MRVDINVNDFRFERAEEVDGPKKNVFAILWTPQANRHNEFYIAIDDRLQYDIYEAYLNNLLKICRIIKNGELDYTQ